MVAWKRRGKATRGDCFWRAPGKKRAPPGLSGFAVADGEKMVLIRTAPVCHPWRIWRVEGGADECKEDGHASSSGIRLHRLGRSRRQIARQLGVGRDTIRAHFKAVANADILGGFPDDLPVAGVLRAIVEKHFGTSKPPLHPSSIDRWRPKIEALLKKGASPTPIHDYLRLHEPDYEGSLSTVKRMCLRLKQDNGPKETDVAIPVETGPGEVAQVDFGYTGKRYDPESGVLRRSWVFVMTLGYSRHMYLEIVFDQKIKTWIELHIRAFEFFDSVPAVLIPDNLKAAVIRAAFGVDDDPVLNRSYRELARRSTPRHRDLRKKKARWRTTSALSKTISVQPGNRSTSTKTTASSGAGTSKLPANADTERRAPLYSHKGRTWATTNRRESPSRTEPTADLAKGSRTAQESSEDTNATDSWGQPAEAGRAFGSFSYRLAGLLRLLPPTSAFESRCADSPEVANVPLAAVEVFPRPEYAPGFLLFRGGGKISNQLCPLPSWILLT